MDTILATGWDVDQVLDLHPFVAQEIVKRFIRVHTGGMGISAVGAMTAPAGARQRESL